MHCLLKKYLWVAALTTLVMVGCGKGNQQVGPTKAESPGPAAKGGEMETSVGAYRPGKGQAPQEGLLDMAKAYATDLVSQNFDQVNQGYPYDPKMQQLADGGALEKGLLAGLKDFGKAKAVEKAFLSSRLGTSQMVSVPCQMEKSNVNINVIFDEKGQITGVHFAQYAKMPEGVKEEELDLVVDQSHRLPGILTLPEKQGKYPVVVLVHGSGAMDRDETVGANKMFRDLAWGLAKDGIGVYRYDKRTFVYGKEMAQDKDFTVNDETVDDGVLAVSMLKGEDEIDPSRIFLLGHSLGGYMIPRMAADAPGAKGYILVAAPAKNFLDLMKEQFGVLARLDRNVTKGEQKQLDQAYAEIEKAKNPGSLPAGEAILGAYPAYWKDLDSYDVLEEAQKITKPVLVLQGEEDYQVPMDNFEIWKKRFGKKANWTFQSFPGLTHLMTPGEKKNGPLDYQKPEHVDPKVVEAIKEFVDR